MIAWHIAITPIVLVSMSWRKRHRCHLERTDRADPGIVDQYVDLAGGFDQIGDAALTGDIYRQYAKFSGIAAEVCGLGMPHRRGDVPALREEVFGDRLAIARFWLKHMLVTADRSLSPRPA